MPITVKQLQAALSEEELKRLQEQADAGDPHARLLHNIAIEVNQRDQLKAVIGNIASIEPSSLVRTEDLGKQLDFSEGLAIFERVIAFFREAATCGFELVAYGHLQQMYNACTPLQSLFAQIQAFSVGAGGTRETRDNLIIQVLDTYTNVYGTLVDHMAFEEARKRLDLAVLRTELDDRTTEMKQTLDVLSQEGAKAVAEIKTLHQEAQEATGSIGVMANAKFFEDESKKQKTAGYYWLGLAVIFGVLAVLYILLHVEPQLIALGTSATPSNVLSAALPRFVVVYLILFALLLFARNYSACQHNLVVNRHRHNLLRSYRALVDGLEESGTRDAMLVQAAQAIFAPQSTGYLKGEGEPPQSNQVWEIVRNPLVPKE